MIYERVTKTFLKKNKKNNQKRLGTDIKISLKKKKKKKRQYHQSRNKNLSEEKNKRKLNI